MIFCNAGVGFFVTLVSILRLQLLVTFGDSQNLTCKLPISLVLKQHLLIGQSKMTTNKSDTGLLSRLTLLSAVLACPEFVISFGRLSQNSWANLWELLVVLGSPLDCLVQLLSTVVSGRMSRTSLSGRDTATMSTLFRSRTSVRTTSARMRTRALP